MFKYDEFLAEVKNKGIAKQNRFYINIAAPVVTGQSTDDLRAVHLLCHSANVPGVAFSSQPVRSTGEVHEAPYDRNFSAANLTFYVDKDMKVRHFFDEWMNLIQNTETRTMSYRQFFEAPVLTILVLRMDDRPAYLIQLHEVYPKSIGALSLSNENAGMMTLDVTFDYKYYTTSRISSIEMRPTKSTMLDGVASVTGTTNSTSQLPGIQKLQDAVIGKKSIVENWKDSVSEYYDVDSMVSTYESFKGTLDGYYKDVSDYQKQLDDQLNKYGVKLDTNIISTVKNTVNQTVRGQVLGDVQKVFGGKLGVFF